MIKLLRVDHRLVHGQVAINWSRHIGADCILVANDEVAKDEMRQSMLRLSKPQGMKLVIKSVEDSIKALKSGVTDKYNLFIVVNNILDVERLTDAVPGLKHVNLGVLPANEHTIALSKAINVTKEDMETLTRLLAKQVIMEIQQVPTESVIQVDVVVATVTGLLLGDPVQGVIMGSVLELMFIGSFPVGAAVSPDYTSAGAICTAFAILSGGGKADATAMALPIALLGGFIFIGCKLINAVFGQVMMRYVEKDDTKGASRIYVAGSVFTTFVIYFAYGFVCVFAGSSVVEAVVNAIPTVIIDGLAAAANLLPAVGFALLLQMIVSKKMSPFLFIGFILAAYAALPTIAVTLLAVMFVLVMVMSKDDQKLAEAVVGGDENEF